MHPRISSIKSTSFGCTVFWWGILDVLIWHIICQDIFFFALYVSLSNYQIVRLYYLWVGGVIPSSTYLSTEQVCSHKHNYNHPLLPAEDQLQDPTWIPKPKNA